MQKKQMSKHVKEDIERTQFVLNHFISYEIECAYIRLDLQIFNIFLIVLYFSDIFHTFQQFCRYFAVF